MSRPRLSAALATAVLAGLALPGPAAAQVVFDPSVFARQFDQLLEMKRQVETMSSQLKVAQDQLGQAKQLYDSFNKVTSAGDVAGLLNSDQFRKYLPSDFSQIESLMNGSGSGSFAASLDGYLNQNRVYTANPGNSFYASELDRIARRTGTADSIGQSVYDTATKRIDELDRLRQQIGQSRDAKDVLDLSARVQVESAQLNNDLLRMQGLSMVQRARAEMDAQREREHGRKLVDEMKAAVR